MAGKALEIHPSALTELKFALGWNLERNETAALKSLPDELDRAMYLVIEFSQSLASLASTAPGNSSCGVSRLLLSIARNRRALQVLAIAQGHRRPGYWKNRL